MKGSLLQGFEELMIVQLYVTRCKYSLNIKVRRVMACDGMLKHRGKSGDSYATRVNITPLERSSAYQQAEA